MARTFYALARASGVADFEWRNANDGTLLAFNELWDEALKLFGSVLIFRVRAENDSKTMGPDVTIESCVGLIDSTTRWRTSADFVRVSMQSIRVPSLLQLCTTAYNAVTQRHQASVPNAERQAIVAAIGAEVEALLEQNKKHPATLVYACEVSRMVASFVASDNEYEAIATLPYPGMFALNITEADKPKGMLRMQSIEALSSAMLLTQSFARLAERAPEWIYLPMPVLDAKPEESTSGPGADESLDDSDEKE